MPLPDSFITELTDRNDIESVVSSYVRLKRRGRTLVGLCPFHGEKTPSFTVYPETSSFYCFGCGAGGDVITFIKRIENLDYLDAVKFLADRAGLRLPENTPLNDAASKLRLRVLEANREAARFYHAMLRSPGGQEGLRYFRGRGYSDATIRHFGLGYAPDGFYALCDALHQKGFTDDELVAAFLGKRGRNGKVYDVFRHRVIIPVIDIRGNVIAFGGRVLDDSKPKYLNSGDTLVFKKSQNLFALNFAKAAKDGRLILCEGYMDVIAMHQAGFTEAVAACGTSFTEEQARLIARYAQEVVLIFDADAAGQKAAGRAIGILRQTGVRIRVVTIPDGKDPDEFIKKNGAERFKVLLNQSANDIEYRLIELGRRHELNTSNGRVAYLRDAAALLAELQSPVERDVYAGKLAKDLEVSKDAILQQVKQAAGKRQRRERKSELSQVVRDTEKAVQKVNPDAGKHLRAARAEEALLGMLILHPDYIRQAQAQLPPDWFATGFNRTLYERLCARAREGLLVELPFLAADYDGEEMAYISHMVQAAKDLPHSPAEMEEYIGVLKEEHRLRFADDVSALSNEGIEALLTAWRETKK